MKELTQSKLNYYRKAQTKRSVLNKWNKIWVMEWLHQKVKICTQMSIVIKWYRNLSTH